MPKRERTIVRKEEIRRLEGRMAFVQQGRNLEEIRKALGVSLAKLNEWYTEDNWEKERSQYLLSSGGVVSCLEQQLRLKLLKIQASEGEIKSADAHVALMISKAIKEYRGDKANMSQVFAVVQDFVLFLRGAAPDLMPTLEPLVERFLHAQRRASLATGA